MRCKFLYSVDDLGESYAHSHTRSINPASQESESAADLATNLVLSDRSFQISALTLMV